MTSKHTPGPWRVVRPKKPNGMFYIMGQRHRYFAEVRDYDGEDGADAHLIAAAPHMLTILKTLALHAPNLDAQGIRELCDEAIAKAEGRA